MPREEIENYRKERD